MDIKTERRIKAYKAKLKQDRSKTKPQLNQAQLERKRRLKEAKKKKPGFGSSSSSVADHLNEVVGLVEHKETAKERRDKRIEMAAKRGLGCRRFMAAADPSIIPSGGQRPRGVSHQTSGRASSIPQATVGQKLGGTGGSRKTIQSNAVNQQQQMRDARAAYFARMAENSNQTESA